MRELTGISEQRLVWIAARELIAAQLSPRQRSVLGEWLRTDGTEKEIGRRLDLRPESASTRSSSGSIYKVADSAPKER